MSEKKRIEIIPDPEPAPTGRAQVPMPPPPPAPPAAAAPTRVDPPAMAPYPTSPAMQPPAPPMATAQFPPPLPPAGAQMPYAPVSTQSGKATASMILGILALLAVTGGNLSVPILGTLAGFVLAILAIILGVSAKNEIRADPNLRNRGQAQAGLIMGWISVALNVLIVIVIVIAVVALTS